MFSNLERAIAITVILFLMLTTNQGIDTSRAIETAQNCPPCPGPVPTSNK